MFRSQIIPYIVLLSLFSYWITPFKVNQNEDFIRNRQTLVGEILVLDREGNSSNELVDGNLISLNIKLANSVEVTSPILFLIGETSVADCVIPIGNIECSSGLLTSLGWFWDMEGLSAPGRTIRATLNSLDIASVAIRVKPRPVVMVHGFASSWEAWSNYLGPLGYLAQKGLSGFAVGDGQVEGIMNTGSLDNPSGSTNTIHKNAEVVSNYIASVKQLTGAEMVDLIAHSMGGLISRDYIGTVMLERDVSQLIMLGSPMSGTDCANLPASLGLYLPATLEIRPSYVVGIFNRNVTERHGISFHALAGNPIQEAFKSPCTSVPTDIAVSLNSVTAIPLDSVEMSILHQDLNTSQVAFDEYVYPLLRKSIGKFSQEPIEFQIPTPEAPLQFTQIYSGKIGPGESVDVTIPIEVGVTVASFALYDTSRTLALTVRGASGNVIDLTVDKNGLVIINDPSSLFYLGYGFNNPKPGIWRVTLAATPQTPLIGAEYAITAYMIGGAVLNATVEPTLPKVNDPIQLVANLSINNELIVIETAQASIRIPDGQIVIVNLDLDGAQAQAKWNPGIAGIYAIDLFITGNLTDGTHIERTAFLSIEAQPDEETNQLLIWVIPGCLIITGIIVTLLVLFLLFRKQARK